MVKASVIIPTFGLPVFLENSIKSVLSQTEQNIEIIIVDDNNPSTEAREKTSQLVNLYKSRDSRIKYYYHEENKNGAVARNTGLKYANGKYIAFLDSDDEYFPTRIEKCIKTLENAKDKKIGGVYSGCEFRRGGKVYHVETGVKSGSFLVESLACNFKFCSGSNIFIKKSIIEELEGFDETFNRHQDYEFLVRYFEKYQLEAIQEVLIVKNNENFNLPNLNNIVAIKKKYLQKYQTHIENLKKNQQDFIYTSHYIALAELAIKGKNSLIAKEYYKKARMIRPLSIRTKIRRLALSFRSLFNR